ncbi:MAG: sodium-dependent transporter [Alphaproteobacteria bacterium]|nr:sodium-dependent transporter [Alphaproteobacteria bacterium]
MAARREHFGSRLGFILAAAGSAVGLGNIWKFPYTTGANGGAAFLVLYLALTFSIGLSIMLAEFAVGRAAERNPVGAFAKLKGGAWPVVGYLGVAAGFIILSFYGVVAGWTIAYIVKTITGELSSSDPEHLGNIFGGFISNPLEPVVYQAIFMALTVGVVLGGVHGGIERWCKVLMPLLFILLLVLIVRSLTLPGAAAGLSFYLEPDLSEITAETFNAALAQAFFSLSLGMGAMITYASYLSHKENLPGSAIWVTSLDATVAILAGLLIMPAVFAFGYDPGAGPGLTFITLPAVFAHMPLGEMFAVLFFLLLTVAALTSSVSLLQVVVAYFVDERGVERHRAAIIFGVIIFAIGVPSSLSLGVWSEFTIGGKAFLDLMDYVSSNLMLPIGGFFISIFVGWVVYPKILAEATNQGEKPFPLAPLWAFICRFVAPVAIAWILISGL